jgi:GGDEF domain-containing protein
VSRKIRDVVGEPLTIDGHPMPVGVSIGVALARVGDDATTVIRNADMALYRAKKSGHSTIEAYDPKLDA